MKVTTVLNKATQSLPGTQVGEEVTLSHTLHPFSQVSLQVRTKEHKKIRRQEFNNTLRKHTSYTFYHNH